MEVGSNGKTEETQNLIPEEEVAESKPEAESVRESVIKENNSEHPIGAHGNTMKKDVEDEEEIPSAKDSGMQDSEAEEKEGINSIVVSVLPQEPSSTVKACGEEAKGEDESNQTAATEADDKLNRAKETMLSSVASEVDSSGVVDIEFQSSDDKVDESAMTKDTVSVETSEKVLPSSDESVEVLPALTDVEQKAIDPDVQVAGFKEKTGESSSIVDKEPAETVDDSSKSSTDAFVVSSEDGLPATSKGNPHVISVNQRNMQTTSWKSCCGLFEVIGGSR